MYSYVLGQYQNIAKATYHTFEIYHLSALNSMFEGDFNARDIQMLSYIRHAKGETYPTKLKELFKLKFSALSNRLLTYEKLDLIVREKAHPTAKKVIIKLTAKGIGMVHVYEQYIESYLKKVRKALSLKESMVMLSTLDRLKTLVYAQKPQEATGKETKLSSKFLFDVFNYFTLLELDWMEEKNITLKQADLLLLSEFYQKCVLEGQTFISLAHFLRIPYQTLMSKVRKFKQDDIILTIQDTVCLRHDIQAIVEDYMALRTIIFYDTILRFQPKEQAMVYKLFSLLKEHALDYTTLKENGW